MARHNWHLQALSTSVSMGVRHVAALAFAARNRLGSKGQQLRVLLTVDSAAAKQALLRSLARFPASPSLRRREKC